MGWIEYLFETKKGKTIMGLLYGMGAAVVIMGALFKIMHWPGSGPMLVIGLTTEALIFAYPHSSLNI
jgi:gliding motility-associated protein GldL